jgi:hypothetical protein
MHHGEAGEEVGFFFSMLLYLAQMARSVSVIRFRDENICMHFYRIQ